MPIRQNRAYHDPNIGAAFSNLASIFAPPSAQDTAAYAVAGAKRAEAQRLAEFFDYAKNPNYSRDMAERLGVGAGVITPAQGYYAVDQGNVTARRGQDVSAQTSLTTNAADNARALEVARLAQTGETTRAMLSPVAQDATRFVPPSIAQMFGTPETQVGVIEAKPGERITAPDGRTFEGAAKPLNESEWKAAEAQAMRSRGALDDETMKAIIFGSTPVENVQTPTGPRIATRTAAIGQRPAPEAARPSDLSALQSERAALVAANPDDPRIREYDARIGALGRGAAQDAYSVENDKALAARNVKIQDAALAAQSKLSTLGYIGQLLDRPNIDTGKGAEARLELRKALKAIGIDLGDVGSAEALRAVSNQFALELRNPEGGAGMPGALSDSDRQFLTTMVPGLANTPEGNRQILDFAGRVARRNVEIERMRQNYVRQRGRIDENFLATVTDFAAQNPLFPQANRGSGPAPAPKGASSGAPGGFKILRVE